MSRRSVRDWGEQLWPVALVAIGVVAVGAFLSPAVGHTPSVQAEELRAKEISSIPGQGTQELSILAWGGHLTLPLGQEVSLLRTVAVSPDEVRLGSAALSAFKADCAAAYGPLGTLKRAPIGTYRAQSAAQYYIAAHGVYEYTYERPRTSCTNTEAGHAIVNREAAAIIHGLEAFKVGQ